MELNITAIVQARMGSTRLPGKVMKEINGKPLIEYLLMRLNKSKLLDKIILATGLSKENDNLANFVQKKGFDVFRGEDEDVLSRYFEAAKNYNTEIVVRITGDCPIIDVNLMDNIIKEFLNNKLDYLSNTIDPTFPDGLDIEVFTFNSLEIAALNAKKSFDKEHVTPFIKRDKRFKRLNYYNDIDYSEERWTVDDPEDLIVIKNIINHFHPNIFFSWQEVMDLKNSKPKLFSANKNLKRNEGAIMGKGQKLYRRAKKIIPGGTMLLSKRPEMFLPDNWPAYFEKSKGCKVWDLDGREYIDMSIMGIGTNILGYGNPEVDEAVIKTIDKGNMSTLNCPEEVYLSEKLIKMHPWSGMVRFARSGGEANSIAVRIARAASGKDKIAICGYHGWHDWYLSANLSEKDGLDGHLLPGLSPNGIPKNLAGTTIPFKYNDFNSLIKIIDSNDIGIIKMEVSRSDKPKDGFLEKVRDLANQKNIILIFDECTSGFREAFGGLHKKYKVDPDMLMLGKALGNGYAITAVLGKNEIMKYAEDTFISSTFWTERIGPSAALKTLEIMERERSWELITQTGKMISKLWSELAKKHSLDIKINGLPSLTNFTIISNNWLKYKTLISQEMLKRGFLASNTVYSCTQHTHGIIEDYKNNINEVFELISSCENGKNIDDFLDGPVCHSGFARLN